MQKGASSESTQTIACYDLQFSPSLSFTQQRRLLSRTCRNLTGQLNSRTHTRARDAAGVRANGYL